MKNQLDRRGFLRMAGAAGAGIGLISLGRSPLAAAPVAKGAPNAEKLGWRLGCQAYSFNRFTFYEAVDKVASLGLHYIEVFPGQRLSREKPNEQTNESMSPALRKEVKQKLADSGVKMVCFGVGGHGRGTFEFAKDMGIETLVCEPSFEAFDEIEKLCEEFEINVALHNHPKPSRYWNPDTVLKVCEGRSKRIGACADTGHWMRSGLNPIECLKKLEGRIVSFHFKDLNQMGGGHDVPWGTGAGDVKGMLTEIHRQKIQAVFSIEYEHNWDNSLPEIAECVAYFDKVAAELAAKS
ncbi:MAG: sugar phosphate isomerase/epimerase [Pirellulales bacterium]|nr:sugar phosphate isomerase/epimerase [Pirellulales bacterium]